MNKKVLIVIAVYNGAEYIRDCFSSLRNLNYPKENYQILVIDNASVDNSLELIRKNFSEVKIIENENNLGFAAGNNVGIRHAITNGFDYVYLLNQDTEVNPDFLVKAVELGESDQQIGAIQSKLLLFQDKSKINSIGNEIHYLGFAFAGGYRLNDHEIAIKEITYPSGACVLLKIDVLKGVGLFNEELFAYHEDTDLGWRIWLGGYKVFLAPDSIVYHKYEFSRSIKKFYLMERNRRILFFQNYKLPTIFILLPAFCLMNVAMFFYSFIAGWWKEEFRVIGYFLDLNNWLKIIKTRKVVQSKRKVGDKNIIKKFVGKIEFQDIQNPLLKYIANPIFNLYWAVAKIFIFW